MASEEQLYTFSSRPTTPRERTHDITVKFQAIDRSNGTIVTHFFKLSSSCKLTVVRRQISHAFRDLYEKGFVFMCKNKEIVRARENEFTLFDILPKVLLGRPTENFRFQDVSYRRISLDVEGRRHFISCACVVFIYEGSGISHWQREILLQALCEGTSRGYGFIPCDVTSCTERLPDVHVSLVFEYAADKRKSVQDLVAELDKLPGDINLQSLRDHRMRNPLHYAAESCGLTPQQTLQKCENLVMKLGRDQVYDRDACGKSPLHCALYRRRLKTAAYLLQLDPDIINTKDIYSNTSFDLINDLSKNDTRKLMNFVKADCLDEILVFHFACYAIRMKSKKLSKRFTCALKNVEYVLELGRNVLHLAGEFGDSQILENVLKVQDNVLVRDSNGYLPFHCACNFGQENIIALLLHESMTDEDICFGIRLALRSNHIHVIKEITKIRSKIKMDALTLACITAILNDDFNAQAPRIFPLSDNENILASRFIHHAAYLNQADIIRTLVTMGADPNLVDMMGRTPLHEASQRNNVDAVACLLESGVDPNITDWRYSSPLHYACAAGHLETVKILMGVDAIDPKIRDVCGRSALLEAGYRNRGAVADYLIREHQARLDFSICDVHGFTILHYASCLAPSTVDILLGSGVVWRNARMSDTSPNPAKHWHSEEHLWQLTDVYEKRGTILDEILRDDKDAFTKEINYRSGSAKSDAYARSKQSSSTVRNDFSTGESPLEVALKKRCTWLALKLCHDIEGYLSENDYGVWSSLITAIDTFSHFAVAAIFASKPVGLDSASLLYRSLSRIQWDGADIKTTEQEHIVRSLLTLEPEINGRCCSRHIDNMYEIREDFDRNADICVRCLSECENFDDMPPNERKSLYKEGLTLLEMASWANSASLIEMLLNHGAIPGCDFAVHNAMYHGNVTATRKLLERMQSNGTDNMSAYAEYMKRKLTSKNRSIVVAACLSRNTSLGLLEVIQNLCPLAFKNHEVITGHSIKAISPVDSRYTLPYLQRLQTGYSVPLLALIESRKSNSKNVNGEILTNMVCYLLDHGDFQGKMQINKTTFLHGACAALKAAANADLGDVVNALITHEWNIIVQCKLANDPSTCCVGNKRSIAHMLLCNRSREPLPSSVIQNIVHLSQDLSKPTCARDVYLILKIVFPMWEFHLLDCKTYKQMISIIKHNADLGVIPGRCFWSNSVELLNLLRRIAAITFDEKDRFWELFQSLDSAEQTLIQIKRDGTIDLSGSYRDIMRLFRKMVGKHKKYMNRDEKCTSIVRDVVLVSGNVVQICEKFMERETSIESHEDFITAINTHIEESKSPGRKFWESSKVALNTLGDIADSFSGDVDQYRTLSTKSSFNDNGPISLRDKLRATYVKMLRELWRYLNATFREEHLLDFIPTAYLPANAMNAVNVFDVAPGFSNIFPTSCCTYHPLAQMHVTPEQMNFEQFLKYACQSGSLDHLLNLACSFGNTSVVRQIVHSECPPLLDVRSDVCEAPLNLAVTNCYPDIVRILLDAGAVCRESHLISACQSVNLTMTTRQLKRNREKIMKLLCDQSGVDKTSIHKALLHAASLKQWTLVDTLLQIGGKINTMVYLDSKTYRDEEIKAIMAKKRSRRTKVDKTLRDVRPVMRQAVKDIHLQTDIYLDEEEKATLAKQHLRLLIDGCVKNCCQASIWKILEHLQNLTDDAYVAMMQSLTRHLQEGVIIKAFTMLSPDPRLLPAISSKHFGETIFHIAASRGHSSLLRWLIDFVKGGDSSMDICLATGTGPLWTALANSHWETAKLLIFFGSTYLSGGRSVPGLLPKRIYHLPRDSVSGIIGNDPKRGQHNSERAGKKDKLKSSYEIKRATLTDDIPSEMRTLIRLHDSACKLKCTILQVAAAAGRLNLVKEILEVNSDIALQKDEQGRSVGFYAAYNGHVDILQYFHRELHQVDMDCIVALLGGTLKDRGCLSSVAESVTKELKKKMPPHFSEDLNEAFIKMRNWGRSNIAVKQLFSDKKQIDYKNFLSCLRTLMDLYGNDSNKDLILLIISIIDNPIIVKEVLRAPDFTSGSLLFSPAETVSVLDVTVPIAWSGSNKREGIILKKKIVASCLQNQNVTVAAATIRFARKAQLWGILEEIAKWERRQETTSEQTLDEWKTCALSASYSGNSKLTSIICKLLSVKCEEKTFQMLLAEALQYASHNGSRDTVDVLLALGGSIDLNLNEPMHDFIKQTRRYFEKDWTSLHSAAATGRRDLMKFYLHRVENSSGKINEEIIQQLIFLSASNGHLITVKLLKGYIRIGTWEQTVSQKSISSIYPDDNVILTASRRGQEDVCFFLIDQLPVSDFVDLTTGGCHLLHFTAMRGMSKLCERIMKVAPDSKNAKDNRNLLPLEYAVAMGQTDVVLLLCDRYSSLQEGPVLQNYPGWFRYTMKHNGNITAPTMLSIRRALVSSRAASFNNSVKRGDDKAARNMLLAGKPQFLHEIMKSPQIIQEYLGEIAENGCVDTLQTLLQFITQDCTKSPSDFLQRENIYGYTPVCSAVINKHVKTLEILLNAEKPTSWKHKRTKENILHLAARGGHANVVQQVNNAVGFILRNAVDTSGLTPMGTAAALGLTDCLHMMMGGERLKSNSEHNDHMRDVEGEFHCLHCLVDRGIGWSKIYQSDRHAFERLPLRDVFKDLTANRSESLNKLLDWYMLCKETSILSAGMIAMGYQKVSDSCIEYLLVMRMSIFSALIKGFEIAAIRLYEMEPELGDDDLNYIISLAASLNARKFLEHHLKNNPGRLTGFDSIIEETVIETSLGFGYFDTGWHLAKTFSKESIDKACKNFMAISDILPVKIAWIIGAAKLGDESWKKSLLTDECRLSLPDVWLSTTFPDDLTSAIMQRCDETLPMPAHLPQYDTTLSYDLSSFQQNKNLKHHDDVWIRSMLSSNIILGRYKENMAKFDNLDQEIAEIKIICLPDATTEAPSITNSKRTLVDKVCVEMNDDQLVLRHDESFIESHALTTWKTAIQSIIEHAEHQMMELYDFKVRLKVDWRSIDANSKANIRNIYRECAESGLCGLVDTLHTLLSDIEILFDSKVCQTNLSEITLRYTDSPPNRFAEKTFGALLAQKTATWDISIREGNVIYDKISLPIWNIRCILRQAALAVASVSSTWNVKFHIEANTFENIPYNSLLKLFATDIRLDLEYIAACYKSMLRLEFVPDRLVLKAAINRSHSGIEITGSTIIARVAIYQDTEGMWCSELAEVDGSLDALEESHQRTCYAEFEYKDMVDQTKVIVKESIGIDIPITIERDQVLSTVSRLSHRSMSDLLSLGKYVLKRFVDDVSAHIDQRIQDFGHRFCFKVGKVDDLQNGLWCLATVADIQNGIQFEELLVLVSGKGVPYFEVQSKISVQALNLDTIIGVWCRHPNASNGAPEKLSATDVPHLWVHQHDIYIMTNRSNIHRLSGILSKTYSLDNNTVAEYLENPFSNLHSLPTEADNKDIRLSEVFIGLEQSLTSYKPETMTSTTRFPFTAKLPYNVHIDRHSLAAFAAKHRLKPERYIEDFGYALARTLDIIKEHLDTGLEIYPSANMSSLDHRNILQSFVSMRIGHISEFDKTRMYPDGVDITQLSERDIMINVVGVPVLDGDRYDIPTFVATLEKKIYDAVVTQCELQICKGIRNYAISAVEMNVVCFKNSRFNQKSFPNDVLGMKLFTDRLGSVMSYVLSTRPIIKSIMLYELSAVNVNLNGKSFCVSHDDDVCNMTVPFTSGEHNLISNSEMIEGILGCFGDAELESFPEMTKKKRLQFNTRDPNYYFITNDQNSFVVTVTDGSGQDSCDKLLKQQINERKLKIMYNAHAILPSSVSKVDIAGYKIEWKSPGEDTSSTAKKMDSVCVSLDGETVLPQITRNVKPEYEYKPEMQNEVLCLYWTKVSGQSYLAFKTSHPEGRQCSHRHSLHSRISLMVMPPKLLCDNSYTLNYPVRGYRYNPFHEMDSHGFYGLAFKFLGTYSIRATCKVCCCPLDVITPDCFVDAGKPLMIKVLKRQK